MDTCYSAQELHCRHFTLQAFLHQKIQVSYNQNIKSQQQDTKLTHDSLYNLHEIATDMPDFDHVIITYPEIWVCLFQYPVPQLLLYGTKVPALSAAFLLHVQRLASYHQVSVHIYNVYILMVQKKSFQGIGMYLYNAYIS